MFRLFELVIICFFLYFVANILRYLFFKESGGTGRMFGLSDSWLKKDEQKPKKTKKK